MLIIHKPEMSPSSIYVYVYTTYHNSSAGHITYWPQSIPLSENASTSLGKSLESMILKPMEFPCWFSCSLFRYPKAQPTGAPFRYALQADRISVERRLKCSSTKVSKCYNKEERKYSNFWKRCSLSFISISFFVKRVGIWRFRKVI